jgi:ribose transport system permease protein
MTKTPETGGGRRSRIRPRELVANNVIVVVLLALIALFSILSPSAFFTVSNFQVMLGSQAVLVLLALALTIALLANEFDLSVGSVMAFSGVLMALLTGQHGWPLIPALIVVLLAAIVIGAFNAFLAVKVGLSSFIVTLGTSTLLAGFSTKLTDSAILAGLPRTLTEVTTTKLFGIQMIFFIAIAIAVILWYVVDKTPLGRWTYLAGSGTDVARLTGLPVDAIKFGALVASSLISGIAGILEVGLLGSADPNSGASFLLPAFAAAFLGATAIKPGRFNVWGTVLAVYMVIVGIVGLQVTTGAEAWIVSVFNGGVLLVAVTAAKLLGRGATDSMTEPG